MVKIVSHGSLKTEVHEFLPNAKFIRSNVCVKINARPHKEEWANKLEENRALQWSQIQCNGSVVLKMSNLGEWLCRVGQIIGLRQSSQIKEVLCINRARHIDVELEKF